MSITSTKITKGVLIREEDTLTPKEIEITPGGTPGTKTSLTSSQNTDKTLVLPNGNDTLVGNVTPAILTQKSIDAEQNTIVNISNTNIKNGANIAVNKLAPLTVGKAVQTNISTGAIESSSVTNTELGYVSGVTSSIQTQITTNASNAASALSAHTSASSSVHGVSGAVVGTTDTQTLTSKTIVVANNTVTTAASGNLTSTNLNAALAELQTDIDTRDKIVDVNDKVNTSSINDRIYADGVVDNHQNTVDGIHGIAGSVVGTFDDQILTNKDIDGGTASNTSRITLPKNTKTNLDALTRKEGTLVFDTVGKSLYIDDGTQLNPIQQLDLLSSVGIGIITPNSTSMLDVTSTTKGFLQPRMTTTQRNAITTPATGLSVYDTTLNLPYYYNGTAWQSVIGIPVVARAIDNAGQSIPTGAVTIVDFNNTFFDTSGGITTGASWKFTNTTGVAAYFRVSSNLNLTSATGGGSLIIYIYRQGVQYSTNYTLTGGAAPYAVNIDDIVRLEPGQYIDVRVLQNAGVSRSLSANNSFIAISQVK